MTEPTDAEIVAVMRDGYNCRYNDEQDHIDFARAVLAKWSTPAPVGVEPAQWQKRHQLRTNGEWENTNEHDAKWWRDNSQGWEIRALYTTPQPTRMQAEPQVEQLQQEIAGLRAALAGTAPASLHVDALAQEIRKVDGRHDLGAGALAEALMPFLASTAPASKEYAEWVPVAERLPEPELPVLLDIGTKFPIRAMWATKGTVEAWDDDSDWAEYDEETGAYYCPEGWYEWNQHEEVHWAVNETPIAWMELPATLRMGGKPC